MGIIALDKQLTLVKKLLRCFFLHSKKKPTKPNQVRKKNNDDEEFEFSFIFIRNIMRFPQ